MAKSWSHPYGASFVPNTKTLFSATPPPCKGSAKKAVEAYIVGTNYISKWNIKAASAPKKRPAEPEVTFLEDSSASSDSECSEVDGEFSDGEGHETD